MISSGPVQHELPVDVVSRWEAFFQGTEYMQRVRELEDLYPDRTSIYIDFSAVDRHDSEMAIDLIDHPVASLRAAAQAVKQLMHDAMRDADISVRVSKLPRDVRVGIRDLRGQHLGRLVCFDALVTRATQAKHDVRIGMFRCARCGQVIKHPMEAQLFSEPLECYKDQDGCGRSGGTTRFRFLADEAITEDIQKIECQEPLEGSSGTSPARITVWLTGDISGTVTAGNRIILNGIPRMARSAEKPKSTVMDTEVIAISAEVQGQEFGELEVTDEDREMFEAAARDPALYTNLIGSIAPSIRGYEVEKAAMLLQLFGGVPKVLDDGSRLRGNIHLLLVGDPGVAKSVMVRYMSKLAPRGVFASGKSSSAAGLTCAAVPDAGWGEGRWVLEAGAMVLADNGFLAVDELDKMDDKDRSSMHEGMEQQEIHVNKAGITATLPTRCSILAAMNPKLGRFDENLALVDQLNIPDTLVSRFDAVFIIQDRPNESKDSDISAHILASHRRGGALANRYEEGMDAILAETDNVAPIYDAAYMRKYVAYAKRINPVLSNEAVQMIQQHYVTIRKLGEGNDKAVPITARQLDGYIRMAEASARMRLSRWVEEVDARRAIDLVEYYLNLFTSTGGERDADRLMTGIPRKDRSDLAIILDTIKEAGQRGITLDELVEIAEAKYRIADSKARSIVRKLKEKGEIMEPNPSKGLLMVVN